VTLFAPAFHDYRLLALAGEWRDEAVDGSEPEAVKLAVVGAHLSGLPLNGQLTERGARLLDATTTARAYRLYALPGTGVPRPGLVRVADGGAAIAVEVWELSTAALGELLGGVPAPLGIGRVTLADGDEVAGFVCEEVGALAGEDITALGGWRAYVTRRRPAATGPSGPGH
jgi:allophanate hydrolase